MATEFKRKLYKRGSSFETTIPMPLLFALDKNKKYNVIFSFDTDANKWYIKFEEQKTWGGHMYRFRQFLDNLEHYELLSLKQKIEKGKLDVIKEIQQKIREHERKHAKDCVTCSNSLDPYNVNNYTILFGTEDFKKKASFCGLDCLEYFLINIKQIKEGDKNAEKIE